MKRLKSKRFKRHIGMVKAAVHSVHGRKCAQQAKDAEERAKDEEFIRKNRLQLEIYSRNPL